jgi:general stress protein YciG
VEALLGIIGGMDTKEAGRLGGTKVYKTYGSEFYAAIGRKGGEATKARAALDPEYFHRIGKLSGEKAKQRAAARKAPTEGK